MGLMTPDSSPRPLPARGPAAGSAATPTAPARLRFRRRMRLVRGADFQRVYRDGNRARGDLVTIAVCDNGLGYSRLGLSIGKKTWKHAVRRNRLRRLFREAFRLEYAELPVGVDLVVIGSVPRIDPTLAAAREELTRLAKKAHRRYRERSERP